MNANSEKLEVAVVTGASKGIDAAIAKQLGAQGAAVVLNYSSSKGGADKVVTEITKSSRRSHNFSPAQLNLAGTKGDQLLSVVTLYKALGGGWEEQR
jgi:NAD(P)-dependent dehydrogenase (short-subunit alcohol dehydrogenase family)